MTWSVLTEGEALSRFAYRCFTVSSQKLSKTAALIHLRYGKGEGVKERQRHTDSPSPPTTGGGGVVVKRLRERERERERERLREFSIKCCL